jgi:WD40 repeat protein
MFCTLATQQGDTLWTKHQEGIISVKFSPDGNTVAAGINNGNFNIYNTTTGELLYAIKDSSYRYPFMSEIDFNFDGTLIATCGQDSSGAHLKIWDYANNTLLKTLGDTNFSNDNNKKSYSVSFSKDGRYLAASFMSQYNNKYNWDILVWDAQTYQLIKEIIPMSKVVPGNGSPYRLLFSPNGNYLAVVEPCGNNFTENDVDIYNTSTWEIIKSLGQTGPIANVAISDIKFSFDGTKLITGCFDGKARIWDIETLQLEKSIRSPGNGEITSIALSRDNQYVFISSASIPKPTFYKLMISNGDVVYDYNSDYFGYGSNDIMISLSISPNADYFVAGTSFGLILYKSNLTSVLPGLLSEQTEIVFPNPATGKVNINLSNTTIQNLKITIYDLQGRNISTQQANEQQFGQQNINFDCTTLQNGVYFIQVQGERISKTFKLVKE